MYNLHFANWVPNRQKDRQTGPNTGSKAAIASRLCNQYLSLSNSEVKVNNHLCSEARNMTAYLFYL